ncbi:MAG: DUF1801 domain-containing protein [Chitinophagaceae bacterium]
MANAKAKTTENSKSVTAFIKKISEPQRQKDAFAIIAIMKKVSGFEPKMWGPAIVGFGSYHYKYESGREGDAPLIGFSPRKAAFSLYLSSRFAKREELLNQFGKHKTSKACIYFKKIADIDIAVLKKMIAGSLKYSKTNHEPC